MSDSLIFNKTGQLSWFLLSIFGVVMITAIFWGGYKLGSIEQQIYNHEEIPMHNGASMTFVPRTEIDIRLQSIQRDVSEIKKDLKILMNE